MLVTHPETDTAAAKTRRGQRAAASARFRWIPAMVMIDALGNTRRLTEQDDIEVVVFYTVGLHGFAIPDTDDPATLGCLLSLVCEAMVDAGFIFEIKISSDHMTRVMWSDGEGDRDGDDLNFDDLGEALIVALEAASEELALMGASN